MRDTIGPAAAAVHIVCADLILAGHRAMIASEGLPYDVVLDTAGTLHRIQVKGTKRARPRPSRPRSQPTYQFTTTRNHRPEIHGAKASIRRYHESEIDILACVAIDIRQVAYFRVNGRFLGGIHLYAPGTPVWLRSGVNQRRRMDEFQIAAVLAHAGPTELHRLSWEAA